MGFPVKSYKHTFSFLLRNSTVAITYILRVPATILGVLFACMQAADSSQEDELMKISSTGVAEPEKSTTASTEGQKTDDDNKVTDL